MTAEPEMLSHIPERRIGSAVEDEKGFTLLEILIAIFIFAIVMTTIYSAFNAVIAKNEAINQGRGLYEMTRNCLDRMTRDLTAIYVEQPPQYEPPDFDDSPDPYRFVCEEELVGNENFSRLRFAAHAHLPMGKKESGGIAEIVYYVDEIETYGDRYASQYVLRRSDTAFPYDEDEADRFGEEAKDPVICKDVKEFSVTCYDCEEETQTEWDSDENIGKYATPRAVGIKLSVSDGETAHIFQTTVTTPVYREKIEEEMKGP